jgi:hypothetical protein
VILAIAFVDEFVLELRGRARTAANDEDAAQRMTDMSDLAITALLIAALFLILGSGVWIGLTLTGVAWIGMQLFSSRPAGDAMAVTIWGSASQLDADGAAAVRVDGRDPVPHAAVAGHVPRPGALDAGCPGGCCTPTWSAAPSSPPCRAQRGHLRHHRQDDLPELKRAATPTASASARWPAPARWAC